MSKKGTPEGAYVVFVGLKGLCVPMVLRVLCQRETGHGVLFPEDNEVDVKISVFAKGIGFIEFYPIYQHSY